MEHAAKSAEAGPVGGVEIVEVSKSGESASMGFFPERRRGFSRLGGESPQLQA
jgi:hypothetical protein